MCVFQKFGALLGGGGGGVGGGTQDGGGDVLWRKLVERNLMKPEKEKPVYKVLILIRT